MTGHSGEYFWASCWFVVNWKGLYIFSLEMILCVLYTKIFYEETCDTDLACLDVCAFYMWQVIYASHSSLRCHCIFEREMRLWFIAHNISSVLLWNLYFLRYGGTLVTYILCIPSKWYGHLLVVMRNMLMRFDVLFCGIFLRILLFVLIYRNVLKLCCLFLFRIWNLGFFSFFWFQVVMPILLDRFYTLTL